MKQVGRLMGVLVAGSVAFLTASLARTAQAQTHEGQAVVQSIKGSADFSEGGGTWSKLKVGKVLKAGSVVNRDALLGSLTGMPSISTFVCCEFAPRMKTVATRPGPPCCTTSRPGVPRRTSSTDG